jgi:hypothetical protein
VSGGVARAAEDLHERYGDLLTPPLPTGDPDGEACAAIDAAAVRLRGPHPPGGQLTLADVEAWRHG